MSVVERGGAVFEVLSVTHVDGDKVEITFDPGCWIVAPAPTTVRRSARVAVVPGLTSSALTVAISVSFIRDYNAPNRGMQEQKRRSEKISCRGA